MAAQKHAGRRPLLGQTMTKEVRGLRPPLVAPSTRDRASLGVDLSGPSKHHPPVRVNSKEANGGDLV